MIEKSVLTQQNKFKIGEKTAKNACVKRTFYKSSSRFLDKEKRKTYNNNEKAVVAGRGKNENETNE